MLQIVFIIGKDGTLESKTTCFTMLQIVFIIGKDGTLESKTTCFTLSDGSDR